MTKAIIITFLLFCVSSVCFSQSQMLSTKPTWSNSGLEVQSTKDIPIWVLAIDEATANMGLTDERIKTKCEFKIRQMNLNPVDFKITYPPRPYHVMISVQASRSSFLVEISFLRSVKYSSGNEVYEMYATTWSTNGFGAHGNDPDFILSALDGKLEEFLNEFIKTNTR